MRNEKTSDKYEKDMVMEQYPASEAEIDSDGEVKLVVSLGPETFPLPDVYNLGDSQASTTLTDSGLVIKHEYAFDDNIVEGNVISTEPVKGTSVKKGDTIILIMSKGPEKTNVVVPDVRDFSKADAIAKLKENNLVEGSITEDYSDTYAKGKVMGQSKSGGSEVTRGTAIDLVISLGPDSRPTSYTGSVTIDENPFDYPGDSGIVLFQMFQNGKTTDLEKRTMNYDSFPVTLPITSSSGSDATVSMMIGRDAEEGDSGAVLEGGRWVVYEEYGTAWDVEFTAER